jgi:4-hydroxy-tetrahydrodipicolinate reductase
LLIKELRVCTPINYISLKILLFRNGINRFFGTGIPATLWFLSKNRAGTHGFRYRKEEILFIDARGMGEMISRRQRALTDEEIARIADVYHRYRRGYDLPEDEPGFCKIATLEEVRERCRREGQAFFYASNFSLGVNILFHVNRLLARIMERYPQYDITLEETHHIHKLDAPSGTAITLAEDLLREITRKKRWVNHPAGQPEELAVLSRRHDEVPGIHTVSYESEMDILTLTHSAKNRRGFALGAVLAAEYLQDRKGCFGMNDLLGLQES